MSKRTDERPETDENLDAYAKLLKLSDHVMSVAKPKEPKPNNKHVPKRLVKVADRMIDVVIDMGADILEANRIYVGANHYEAVRACMKKGERAGVMKLDKYYKNLFEEEIKNEGLKGKQSNGSDYEEKFIPFFVGGRKNTRRNQN